METLDDLMRELLDPAATSFGDVARIHAKFDWALWARAADEFDRRGAEVEAGDAPSLVKQVELSAIPYEMGRESACSEATIGRMAAQAGRLRVMTPTVWSAFAEGRIDGVKASAIAGAIERLKRASSIERLDRLVISYAEKHTAAELRRWLKAFVARVEPDLFNERAEDARAKRGVDVIHGDEGMSWLTIGHTSPVIAAIDKRLTKEAKALGADDPRTLDQRRADLAAAWLTTNEAGEVALNADIAVTITADALAGAGNEPVISADGSWVAPVAWILELAKNATNNVFWHRMVLDPVTDNVLAHEYKGRFAPELLDKALEFRDGVCQATGCCRPAHLCDMDHRIPHEAGGPTAGWNMGPYCRRHHKLKGFGLIDVGPTTTSPPGMSRNTPLRLVGVPDFSWVENQIEWMLAA